MAFIRKSIDIISPADGKRYTDVVKYEKALDRQGQQVMSESEFKRLNEKLKDEARSQPKKKEEYNHVHIDFANNKVIKSKIDI